MATAKRHQSLRFPKASPGLLRTECIIVLLAVIYYSKRIHHKIRKGKRLMGEV